MFRVYRQFLEKVFLALLGSHFYREVSINNDIDYAMLNWYRIDNVVNPELREIQNTTRMVLDHDDLNLNEGYKGMLLSIGRQLRESDERDDNEGDLIDNMVSVLGLPYSRNVLTGTRLDQLRNALLLPDELVKLNRDLTSNNFQCGKCKHYFTDHEMVTFEHIERQGPVLYCRKCARPTRTVCSKCNDSVALDRSMTRAIGKELLCGKDHSKPDAEVIEPIIEDGPGAVVVPVPPAPALGRLRIRPAAAMVRPANILDEANPYRFVGRNVAEPIAAPAQAPGQVVYQNIAWIENPVAPQPRNIIENYNRFVADLVDRQGADVARLQQNIQAPPVEHEVEENFEPFDHDDEDDGAREDL